jgi:predicted ATPase
MGKILYMDNYRGFKDTFVSLKDVNFLVGENSTGKSSVISLLKVMLSNLFWGDVDLNCDKEEVNTFDELVNQYSDQKECFTVGIGSERENAFYVLLKYDKDKDGLPKLCEYKSHKDGWSVMMNLYPDPVCRAKKDANPIFKQWVQDNSGYVEDKKLSSLVTRAIPFIIHLNMIHHMLLKDNTDNDVPAIDVPAIDSTYWIEPIRAKAKSVYSAVSRKYSEDGAHIPVILKDRLDNERLQKKLRDFGRKSSLFDSIEVDTFGSSQSNAPFSIKVTYSNVKSNINEVGQGVSQFLPVLVDCYMHKNSLISIQQPEVHLHPKAQAAFGEIIYDTSRAPYNNQVVIETHSDYTIDRYRYMISQKGEKKKKTQILFFARTKTGNIIKPIKISENGSFPEKMPKEYGKFFVDEELLVMR